METFSALLAICAGNSLAPVNSPHKGQWRGPLMFSLICAWINGWVHNGEAGDLRRYRAHYDVTVMCLNSRDCHFGGYFFQCFATLKINTIITLEFVATVYKIFQCSYDIWIINEYQNIFPYGRICCELYFLLHILPPHRCLPHQTTGYKILNNLGLHANINTLKKWQCLSCNILSFKCSVGDFSQAWFKK